MITRLPLNEMSVEQKLQTMETLWDDLCSRAEGLPSPWHGEAWPKEAAWRTERTFEHWKRPKG